MKYSTALAAQALSLFILSACPAPAAQQEPAAGNEALRRRARELVTAGKAREAIPLYRQLLRDDPDNTTLLINLAVASLKAEDAPAAAAAAQQAVKLNPRLAAGWLFLGAAYSQMHRFADAVSPLQQAVHLAPSERNARLLLAEALLAENRPSAAAPHFDLSAQQLPDSPRAWYGVERSYDAMAAAAEAGLERSAPDSPFLTALRAAAALRVERFGLALHLYRETLRARPDMPGIHAALASLYIAAGHPDWASVEQQQSAAPCSGVPCLCAAGRYRDCAAQAAALPVPENSYWLSYAWRGLAAEAARRLAALPASPQSEESAARALDQAGRYREAAARWRKAVERGGGWTAEWGLASSLLHAADPASALAALNGVLQKGGDAVPAAVYALAGAAHLLLERPAEAVSSFEQALARDPHSADYHAGAGEALLKAGRPADAVPHLKAALPADTTGKRHFQLAQALRATGQPDAARPLLQQYRRLAEENEAALRLAQKDYPVTAP